MKDFIASSMSERDCKEICRKYLRDKFESDDQIICEDEFLYDKAYGFIRLMVEEGIASTLSDMDGVLKNINELLRIKFRDKFKKKAPEAGQ